MSSFCLSLKFGISEISKNYVSHRGFSSTNATHSDLTFSFHCRFNILLSHQCFVQSCITWWLIYCWPCYLILVFNRHLSFAYLSYRNVHFHISLSEFFTWCFSSDLYLCISVSERMTVMNHWGRSLSMLPVMN